MNAFQKIFQAILGVEETVVPIFFHSASGKNLAAVILAVESAVPGIVAEMQGAAKPESTAAATVVTVTTPQA